MNEDLSERFRKGKSNRKRNQRNPRPAAQDDLKVSLNENIRKYVGDQNLLKSASTKEEWIDTPEIPSSHEIQLADNDTVNLLPNKIRDRYKSTKSYLKTHYALLREDAVGPLRDAVDKFRRTPDMEDDLELSIYEKVHIKGFKLTNMGIAARLRFSTRRAGRKILWSASKRLVSGTLVALTPSDDAFNQKCIIAIVAARPLELLERTPPEIDIYFGSPEDCQIDPQTSFIMLEAKSGYFEAYRHTLRAIQKLSRESFPLSQHIIGSNTDVDVPDYLAKSSKISIGAAIEDQDRMQHTDCFSSIDPVNAWPETPPDTTLDDSQWAALRRILTKKLAIIQGPPGTGKTHVSIVALQILVQNRAEEDPPIIVAAQTNHALDQLLKHVAQFDPNYIRLGGRSTTVDVKKRALYEIRQNERIPPIKGSLHGPAMRSLERQQTRYGDLLSIFDESPKLIPPEKLASLGVINAKQKQSLVDAVENWVSAEEDRDPIQYWLHNALIPFEVDYEDDTFGFDEVEEDLEIEQLREIDAEHGVTDEEDIEMLKGPWKAVSDEWTIMTPSEDDLDQASKMLASKQDLWDIPEYLRGPAYLIMRRRATEVTLSEFKELARVYDKTVEQLKIGKWERDAVFLRRANVIGMTTTGLSKYRPLIASIRPKIILIEEAAEVIEGPVAAVCMESVEHLILIGDHKQLQGHCALKELEGNPFYLNVSMFERLLNLKMPYAALSRQRRMSPEIRQLISLLYPNLKDHESVLTRPAMQPWGTGSIRSFFFHHDWSELKDVSMSTYNEEEARMVAKFYRHLLRHGVSPATITVLTFYNGQRKRILRELKADAETNQTYNHVKTVDSYQGEENAIIILSLVRSNSEGRIGFLENDNRVCVALSRARHGFYIFGNGYLLAEKSELWSRVGKIMSESKPSRFGTRLPLQCTRHKRNFTAQYPEDLDNNDGGCEAWCGATLSCGHRCAKHCHPGDHGLLSCHKRCDKQLVCNHKCTKMCHEECSCDCDEFQEQSMVGRISQSRDRADSFDLSTWTTTSSSHRHGRAALARGGAAFRPLGMSLERGARDTIHEDSRKPVSKAPLPWGHGPQNWTSFAAGTTAEQDVGRYQVAEQKASLLDLFFQEHEPGVVENSEERNIGEHRVKYVQTYRPAKKKDVSLQPLNLMD